MPAPNKKFDLIILVVLYNSGAGESQTMRSLLGVDHSLNNKRVHVCIWNNGPVGDPDLDSLATRLTASTGFSVTYTEYLNNAPLSRVYNQILSEMDADAYLLLDHDSTLPPEFLKSLFRQGDVDFQVPHILASGELHGPFLNSKVPTTDLVFQLNHDTSFFAIGSGLAIYRSGLEKLLRHYPGAFDDNFALYGVDYTLWIRMMAIAHRECFVISCRSNLIHSLSRLENEPRDIAQFRRKERGLDVGITLRRYPSKTRVFALMKLLLKRPFIHRPISGKNPSILWILFGLFAGKHPRCNRITTPIIWHD